MAIQRQCNSCTCLMPNRTVISRIQLLSTDAEWYGMQNKA